MKQKKKIASARKMSDGPAGNLAKVDRKEWIVLSLILALAAIFLFFNLDAKYLWQDEAATAVLGERLFKYGKPYAYDGRNLITMDVYVQDEIHQLNAIAGNPDAAVRYYVSRGDFKSDTTWIGQPWGQFAIAGASIALFGRDTWAARIPFALAALLTVALLYMFVRRQFKNVLIAQLAVAMLVANVYWVMHSRQCRYYSLSGLFLVVTLMAFARWQAGRPRGGAFFVVAAWCWFQVDYGTFWPMIAILLAAAIIAAWPRVHRALLIGGVLGVTIAPWIWYYELFGRVKSSDYPWSEKFLLNLFHLNQFLIPVVIIIAAASVIWFRRDAAPAGQRQILMVGIMMFLAAIVWVPSVGPYAFYRYIVQLSPLAAIVTAWLIGEAVAWADRRFAGRLPTSLLATAAAAFLSFCPLISNVVNYPLDPLFKNINIAPTGRFLRPEWKILWEEVFNPPLDPNRIIVEKLKREALPADEILINYEDIPLMFYLDNPIRGGISCFRVEDSSRIPPRFFVYRRSANFVFEPPFIREMNRYMWQRDRSNAPDVIWGNIPEPEMRPQLETSLVEDIIFGKNLGPLTQ